MWKNWNIENCKYAYTHSGESLDQSTGVLPCLSKSWLHWEKCLHPKNPRWADSGDGCGALRRWCFFYGRKKKAEKYSLQIFNVRFYVTLSTTDAFFWAYEPQRRKTTPLQLSLIHLMTASVKISQPLSLWEFAAPDLTVNPALSRSTPNLHMHV